MGPEGEARSETASAPVPLIPGHRIDSVLGRGGMGAVYLAEDVTLRRRVAIKVLHAARDPDSRKRFLREARALATIEHPNVVRVYSFGEVEDTPYLVMEYVEGETLAHRIREHGALPAPECSRIAGQVASALDASWSKGIIHRDIKPSNILLDRTDTVRVVDFGLAKQAAVEDAEADVTKTGLFVGTPHYISPEQARGETLDHRSDLYSLGLVLFEMLTGQKPFSGPTPVAVIAQHLHQSVPDVSRLRGDAPPPLVLLVAAMTAKDPAARPQSYKDVCARLGAAPAAFRPVAAGGALRALAAAPILLVALAGGALWWYRRSPPLPPAAEDRRLAVVVAPFDGADEEATREGRVMAALIERTLRARLSPGAARVVGVADAGAPVRSHEAARALAPRLGANVVVWGEVVVLRGQSQIQPYVTMVPPADKERAPGSRDALARELERPGAEALVSAAGSNQIELRKTSAEGVGDLVLTVAGLHALYAEQDGLKALDLLRQAPRTPENLRHQATAYEQLGKPGSARLVLQQAQALDPKDPWTHGALGQTATREGRWEEAFREYRSALTLAGGFLDTVGMATGDRLYVWERKGRLPGANDLDQTGYLVAYDPAGRIADRQRSPGPIQSLERAGDGLRVRYSFQGARSADIIFSEGAFARPVFHGDSLLLRRQLERASHGLGGGFLGEMLALEARNPSRPRAPTARFGTPPRTLGEIESIYAAAAAHDPTQPWHAFHLGAARWLLGREGDADAAWTGVFAAPATVGYYEFARMADSFEGLGAERWADRAYEEALRRRRALWQPIESGTLIERLINAPFVMRAAARNRMGLAPSRQRVWLERARELTGPTESDEFTAAIWERHYRARDDAARGEAEARFHRAVLNVPLGFNVGVAVYDYATYGLVVAVSGFVALLGLAVRARPNQSWSPTAWAADWPWPRRRVLLAAAFVAIVAAVWFASVGRWITENWAFPLGVMDSYGHRALVEHLDSKYAENGTSPARYAAAVAHHLAGDTPRAVELYDGLPEDDQRGRTNRPLARRDQPPAAGSLTLADVMAAVTTRSLPGRIRDLFRPSEALRDEMMLWPLGPGVVALALALVALLVAVRPRSGPAADASGPLGLDRSGRGPWPWIRRLVPGVIDVEGGAWWHGYFTLLSFLFAMAVVAENLSPFHALKNAAPGIVTSRAATSMKWQVMPEPVPEDQVIRHYYWTIFWNYPYARVFWPLVVAAALFATITHARALRRRGIAAEHDPPTTTGAPAAAPPYGPARAGTG